MHRMQVHCVYKVYITPYHLCMQPDCEPAMICWRRRGVEQNLPRLYRNTGSLLYACRSIIQNKRCVALFKRNNSPAAASRVKGARLTIACASVSRNEPPLPPDSDEILMCHWLIKKEKQVNLVVLIMHEYIKSYRPSRHMCVQSSTESVELTSWPINPTRELNS